MVARPIAALLACVLATLAGRVRADEPWKPLVARDGVDVEERSGPGRVLPELRAHAEIEAGIFEVLAVISDVPNQTKWMHDCSEARLLHAQPNDVSVIYNRTASPWPVSDRDVVLRTEVTLLEPGKHVSVRFANTSDSAAPPVTGVVRMPRLAGDYDLVAISATRTRITYRLDIDPGGSLPAWLVARTAHNLPLQTLLGLRARVAATQGQYEAFVKRWNAPR